MVRLILISLLFLLSLLCVFPAPEYHVWYVSILVTEFPWIFLVLVSVLLLVGSKVNKCRLPGTIIGLLSFALFLSPLLRAYSISARLQKGIEAEFGPGAGHLKSDDKQAAFSFWHMFTGLNAAQLPYITMPYTSNADGALTLDYYRSQMPGSRPCVVVVHGGSWSGGDSHQLPELNTYLAKAGYNVASINYRLAPKYKYPAPIEDVHAALSYLRAHAAELGVDTTNFVLLGRSAGGQIVLDAAYRNNETGLKGVIDFYGPADMVWGYANPANPLVLNTCKVMENYLGGTYSQVPQNYVASSATRKVNAQCVPTLIIHGRNDPLVSFKHSDRLYLKLVHAGVKQLFLALPWATHGCDYSLNGPSGQLSTYAIERFLNYVTQSNK
jgi:acetyl esterase/lipase